MSPIAISPKASYEYFHCDGILMMTSHAYDVRSPVLIMTSFSLWRHSLLRWSRPP